jgi:peptidoglycan/LPS O-acetylase OafA/YrhL
MTNETIIDLAASHGPSELERVGYLDGWRGLAIAFVLQSHFFHLEWANFGILGVDIFFCLSGLLMSRILFVKRVPLKIFYKRRISRIVPSFLLYVIAVYGFAYASGNALGWIDFTFTILFLRTYFPVQPDLFTTGIPTGHIWSLNVEEHSYIFLSLLTFLSFLKGREGFALIAFGCLSIASTLLYAFVPEVAPSGVLWARTETTASFLLISAGYALLSERMNPFIKPWMPLASLILGIMFYLKVFGDFYEVILSPFLLAFSVNHLAQTPRFFRYFLAITPLRLLGIYSYSIYLWQQPFYFYLYSHDANHFLFLFMALLIGGLLFYLYENPSRTYLNRVW